MEQWIPKACLFVVAGLAMNLDWSDAYAAHVSRCDDGGDTQIYTDGSCRALGAEPAPMPAELMRSLVREGGMDGLKISAAPASNEQLLFDSNRVDPKVAHPAIVGCARTPAQLAASLREALTRRDVNQLATAYDWTGMSGEQTKPLLQRLQRMSDRPLIDGYYFDANDGVVQLVQGPSSAPTVTEFPVTRRAGCLFLQF